MLSGPQLAANKEKTMSEPFTHAFCGNCQSVKPVFREAMTGPSVDGCFRGGDIVCEDCHSVIATVFCQIESTSCEKII